MQTLEDQILDIVRKNITNEGTYYSEGVINTDVLRIEFLTAMILKQEEAENLNYEDLAPDIRKILSDNKIPEYNHNSVLEKISEAIINFADVEFGGNNEQPKTAVETVQPVDPMQPAAQEQPVKTAAYNKQEKQREAVEPETAQPAENAAQLIENFESVLTGIEHEFTEEGQETAFSRITVSDARKGMYHTNADMLNMSTAVPEFIKKNKLLISEQPVEISNLLQNKSNDNLFNNKYLKPYIAILETALTISAAIKELKEYHSERSENQREYKTTIGRFLNYFGSDRSFHKDQKTTACQNLINKLEGFKPTDHDYNTTAIKEAIEEFRNDKANSAASQGELGEIVDNIIADFAGKGMAMKDEKSCFSFSCMQG